MPLPKWFEYPQRFQRQTLTLVGTYIAAAGMIERCIFNGLVILREQGFADAAQPIRNEFAKRHKAWLDAVNDRFAGDDKCLEIAAKLHKRTTSLMSHRHLLVHSFWFGQESAEPYTLFLQQAKESKGQYVSRAFEIEMKYLATHAQGIQPLIDGHMQFLHEKILRQSGTIQEVALPEDWNPTQLRNPNPQGWPPAGARPHRLTVKS